MFEPVPHSRGNAVHTSVTVFERRRRGVGVEVLPIRGRQLHLSSWVGVRLLAVPVRPVRYSRWRGATAGAGANEEACCSSNNGKGTMTRRGHEHQATHNSISSPTTMA
jgi:hypothetical protein